MIAAAFLLLAQASGSAALAEGQTIDCATTRDETARAACAAAEAAVGQASGSGEQAQSGVPTVRQMEERAKATIRDAVKQFCANPQEQDRVLRCAELDVDTAEMDFKDQWERTAERMGELDETKAGDGQPTHLEILTEGQRAWTESRDAQCHSEGLAARGSVTQFVAEAQCKARLTRARTEQLRNLVADPKQ